MRSEILLVNLLVWLFWLNLALTGAGIMMLASVKRSVAEQNLTGSPLRNRACGTAIFAAALIGIGVVTTYFWTELSETIGYESIWWIATYLFVQDGVCLLQLFFGIYSLRDAWRWFSQWKREDESEGLLASYFRSESESVESPEG